MPAPLRVRSFRSILAVGWAVLASVPLAVASPSLARVEPPGARQGAEVEIRIVGSELDGAEQVFFEEGRVEVVSFEQDKDNTLKAKLRIPAVCPPGPQRVRVRTVNGLSDLRMFQVFSSDIIEEKEPNDAFDKAATIEPGKSIWGWIRGEDIDSYKIHLPAGGHVSAVVDAIGLDQVMIDPYVELVDAEGFVIASCDDHPLLRQDAVLSATVKTEGDYYLRVRESAYAGNGIYVLHVGTFATAHVAFPPGGPEGTAFDVEWFGDPRGTFRQQVTLSAPGVDGLARVQPVRDGQATPLLVPFRVTPHPVTREQEPNNDIKTATKVAAPAAVAARMDASDDVDWIRVTAPAGSTWKVAAWGSRLGSPVDLVVAVHRDNDKHDRITSNDDAEGSDAVVQVATPAEGSFLVRVNDFQKRGGPSFVYWLDVTPAIPEVTVALAPAVTNTQERLVASVPRGNRTALFFNATRTGFNDPVALALASLPQGVTAFTTPIADGVPGSLVVLEASADAAPQTTLADVQLTKSGTAAAAPSSERIGGLRQPTTVVFGEPNNTPYRTVLGDRLPVAVVQEAPVTIELVPPPVPVVRRGSMNLKVKIIGGDSYPGRVRLELPLKPPGIGAATLDVKQGQTEAEFPINCAADAMIKDWQIAVLAALVPPQEAAGAAPKPAGNPWRAGRGAWISSKPTTLSVAEPMIDFAAEKTTAEQGTDTKLVFAVSKKGEFTGVAKATLVGLPIKCEAPTLDVRPGDEKFEFTIKVGADAPPGKHDLYCRVEVPVGDTWVIHQSPMTSLRIDKPLADGVAASQPNKK